MKIVEEKATKKSTALKPPRSNAFQDAADSGGGCGAEAAYDLYDVKNHILFLDTVILF